MTSITSIFYEETLPPFLTFFLYFKNHKKWVKGDSNMSHWGETNLPKPFWIPYFLFYFHHHQIFPFLWLRSIFDFHKIHSYKNFISTVAIATSINHAFFFCFEKSRNHAKFKNIHHWIKLHAFQLPPTF